MEITVTQARQRGYCVVSREHWRVSRIDRPDWREVMARDHAPWDPDGEGRSWVEALGALAGDHYRRVYSRDSVSLGSAEALRGFPASADGPNHFLPIEGTRAEDKVACTQCGWNGKVGEVESVPDPKSPVSWNVCPKCRIPEQLVMVCGEPGCTQPVTSGTCTAEGCRAACGLHRPARSDERSRRKGSGPADTGPTDMPLAMVSHYALPDGAAIERRVQRNGSVRWAVRLQGMCLNAESEWEVEPMPSACGEDFLARTRFASPQAAYAAWARDLA